MSVTPTTLANLALGHLGLARISDLDERTVAAEHLRRFWEVARNSILRQYPWSFAIDRKVLTRLSTAPAFDFAYAYQLPEDFLKVLEVNGEPAGTSVFPFEIQGTSLLSNAEDCKLKYTRAHNVVSEWDATFCDLFSYELAKVVAPSFTLQPNTINALNAMEGEVRARAEGATATETKPRVVGVDDHLTGYELARLGRGC